MKALLCREKNCVVHCKSWGFGLGLSRIDRIKARQMAEELMVKRLDRRGVLTIAGEFFDVNDESAVRLAFREGFRYSFRSDSPLQSSATYYQNVQSIYPELKKLMCFTIIEWFRNMIMEKGKSGLHIRNPKEYRRTMEMVNDRFGITPPSSIHVFNSILKDDKSIEKIANNISYYHRVAEIFSFLDATCFKDLDRLVLKRLSSKRVMILAKMEVAEEKRDFNALLVDLKRIDANMEIVLGRR